MRVKILKMLIYFLLLTVTDTEALLSSKDGCKAAKRVLKCLVTINSDKSIRTMKAVCKMLVLPHNL